MTEELGLLNPAKNKTQYTDNPVVNKTPFKTPEDVESEDLNFILSLTEKNDSESALLTHDEQLRKREKWLNAGFTNDEIDEELGIEKPEKVLSPEEAQIKDIYEKSQKGLLDDLANTIDQSVHFLPITAPQVATSFVTGSTSWLIGKVAGSLVGLSAGITENDFDKGVEEGRKVEDWINEKFTYAPTDERAMETVETIGYLLDHINKFSKGVGETIEYGIKDAADKDTSGMMKALRLPQLAPWIRYVAEFGTELAIFKGLHVGGKEIAGGIGKLEGKFGERMPKNIKEVIKEIPKEDINEIRKLLEKETPPEEIKRSGGIDEYFERWLTERTPKEVDVYMGEYFDSWKPQEKVLTPKEKADIIYENILRDVPPQQAISKDVVKKYYEQNPEAKPEEFFSHSVRREIERITRKDQAAKESLTIKEFYELQNKQRSLIKNPQWGKNTTEGKVLYNEYVDLDREIELHRPSITKLIEAEIESEKLKKQKAQPIEKTKEVVSQQEPYVPSVQKDQATPEMAKSAISDKTTYQLDEQKRQVIGQIRIDLEVGEAPQLFKIGDEYKRTKSSNPEYFVKLGENYKGITKAYVKNILNKAEKGLSLTSKQVDVLNELLNAKAEEIEGQKYYTREQLPKVTVAELNLGKGDEFTINGEKFKVTDIDSEGNYTIKDGIEYNVDIFDKIPLPDEGSIKQKQPQEVARESLTHQQVESKQGVESVLSQRVKIGKSPQTYTIIEELKSTTEETALGEKYYNVKNDKTGEVMTVESKDMKPVRKRIISDETLEKNVKDMNEKMSGLHSGIDPTILKHLAVIGAYYLETGVRDFADFSTKVIEGVGTKYAERIKPYLQEAWDKSHETLKKNIIQQTDERLKTDFERVEQKRQKSLFKTAKESDRVSPEVKVKIAELEQEYKVKPNPESIADANKKIGNLGESEALKHVMDDTTQFNDVKMGMFDVLFEKLQERGEYDRAVDLWNAVDPQAREAGRGIQMLSRWNAFKPEGFLKWVTKELDKVNNKKGILDDLFGGKKVELTNEQKAEIIKRKYEINAMADGVAKTEATLALIDDVAKMIPPTTSELIDLYRYQNMLSGFQTQERNIYGGLFNAIVTRPADIAARGTIDYFESVLFGKERQAYISDVPEYYKKAYNALPNAVDVFLNAWKFKTDMTKPDMGFDTQGALKQARAKHAPKYLTVVQRFMEATDKFNLALIKNGDYAVQLKRGLTPEKALAEAEANAKLYLYRNKNNLKDTSLSVMSKLLADIQYLIVRGEDLPIAAKPIKWAIPFLTTPINFGIQMIEHSPASLIRTKGFTQEVRAKILSGSIITAVGTYMAMQDKVTWTVPTGEKEKQMFYAAGKKPFSVDVNGVQVPVWYFGPYALSFMLPAAVKYYYQDQNKALTASQIEKLSGIAMGIARFIGSQSSAQSIGNFFNFISGDVDYSFPSQLAFTSEQMLPLSGLLRNVSKIIDPVYRDPDGFWESIQKDLPLLSDDIPSYQTPTGEDSERQWWNGLLPYEVSTEDALYESLLEEMGKESQLKNLYHDFEQKVKRYGKVTDKDVENLIEMLSKSYND